MKTLKSTVRKSILGFATAVGCFAFSGCDYEAPITSEPTCKIDERVLGNWVSGDGEMKLKVRRFDESNYIVSLGGFLIRAYHSDVAGTSFISLQDIDSDERKYVYLTYAISADGDQLVTKRVNQDVIPKETKDSASVQKLLEKNLENPELFKDVKVFNREKQKTGG